MRNAIRRAVLPVLVLLCITSQAHADRIHVNINTPFDGDGSTWGQAMRSLVDALAMAQPGDEVWVAQGVYGIGANALRDDSFVVPTGVALHGGFVGGENALSERPADFGASQTFLGGGQNNAYSVVRLSGGTGDTIIDPFIIRNGNADGDPNGLLRETRGGGMFINMRDDVLIRDVVIRDCNAAGDGGGLYMFDTVPTSRLTMERVRFNRCIAGGEGGGAYIEHLVDMVDCEFSECEASEGGGLRLAGDTGMTMIGGSFIENRALTGRGGAIDVGGEAQEYTTTIEGVLFRLNTAQAAGGAIAYEGESRQFIRSSVFEANLTNSVDAFGGAIFATFFGIDDDPGIRIDNSLIAGNEAGSRGGGIYLNLNGPDTSSITNCTITGNESRTQDAGGIFAQSSTINIANTIIWDNRSGNGSGTQSESLVITSSADVSNSLVEHWGVGQTPLPGTDTSGDDPMLVDADGPDNVFGTADDNARLTAGSPAIDAGDSSRLATFIDLDIYGDPRRADDTGTPDTGIPSSLGPTIDISAAEFQGATPIDCLADTNGDGELNPADFNAWVIAFNNQTPACDQNGDGLCNPADFNAWVINFNAGC
ncbi:MAG: GC-type dockerin domain-anchored protein [Planctomycetota bacterium]